MNGGLSKPVSRGRIRRAARNLARILKRAAGNHEKEFPKNASQSKNAARLNRAGILHGHKSIQSFARSVTGIVYVLAVVACVAPSTG